MKIAPDLIEKEDKLKPYLESEIKGMLFDELAEDFLEKNGLEFMKGVSVPLRAEDLTKGADVTQLADNMAMVMGADVHFKYTSQYIKFMAKCFNEKLVSVMSGTGGTNLINEQYRKACIYYRAALLLDSKDRDAIFGYACCCREWYLSLEGDDEQELVAILKAEATEYFEWCMVLYEDFAPSYYFLGYAYLNAGQYTKASLVWQDFIERADRSKDAEIVKEIEERVESLKEPVKIEAGINHIISGRYEEGLKVLEPYVGGEYDSWWPLHFYLASAYRELGALNEAVEGFRRVLALSPSHEESAQALADLYAELGDAEMSEKYLNKLRIFEQNKKV